MDNERINMKDKIIGALEIFIESNKDIRSDKILQYYQHEIEKINSYYEGYLAVLKDIKKDLENELYKKKPFELDLDSLCKSSEQLDKDKDEFIPPKKPKMAFRKENEQENKDEIVW